MHLCISGICTFCTRIRFFWFYFCASSSTVNLFLIFGSGIITLHCNCGHPFNHCIYLNVLQKILTWVPLFLNDYPKPDYVTSPETYYHNIHNRRQSGTGILEFSPAKAGQDVTPANYNFFVGSGGGGGGGYGGGAAKKVAARKKSLTTHSLAGMCHPCDIIKIIIVTLCVMWCPSEYQACIPIFDIIWSYFRNPMSELNVTWGVSSTDTSSLLPDWLENTAQPPHYTPSHISTSSSCHYSL